MRAMATSGHPFESCIKGVNFTSSSTSIFTPMVTYTTRLSLTGYPKKPDVGLAFWTKSIIQPKLHHVVRTSEVIKSRGLLQEIPGMNYYLANKRPETSLAWSIQKLKDSSIVWHSFGMTPQGKYLSLSIPDDLLREIEEFWHRERGR
jgi:hypothetical protein